MLSRKLLEVDFDILNSEGGYSREISFDDLDDALEAYKRLYEVLSVASEVPYFDNWRPFSFSLHITTAKPYIITTEIYSL